MIIIGIDPGTIITGIGIIEAKKNKLYPIYYDAIKLDKYAHFPTRLKVIYESIIDKIDTYNPDEFAMETAFYGKNVQSALKIGQARGVSFLAAMRREIPANEYSPREIKKAVTGNGAASKEQVSYMVKTILKISKAPKLFDETDALAVAICHYNRMSSPRAKFTNWKSFVDAHPEKIIRGKQ
jgi:crossover junction endodeoxyribonuclease RuvC